MELQGLEQILTWDCNARGLISSQHHLPPVAIFTPQVSFATLEPLLHVASFLEAPALLEVCCQVGRCLTDGWFVDRDPYHLMLRGPQCGGDSGHLTDCIQQRLCQQSWFRQSMLKVALRSGFRSILHCVPPAE